ncbi:MAG: hypothetical protein U9Q15_03800 [Patescibacteria group bacterium]|nr:hypothetical protein [Patescibacteria group bacterium]
MLKNLDESFSTINVGKVLKAMDSQGQLDKAVGYMEHIPSKYHQILLDQIVQKYDPEIVVGSIHMFKNIDTTELVESLIQQDKIDMLL